MPNHALVVLQRKYHHEDSDSFVGRFNQDVDTLFKAFPLNPFSADKLCKIDGSDIMNTDVLFKTMSSMMDDGEKQFTAYLYGRLVYQKVSLCTIINKNNIVCGMLPINLLENNLFVH